jgi:hypothetical protein
MLKFVYVKVVKLTCPLADGIHKLKIVMTTIEYVQLDFVVYLQVKYIQMELQIVLVECVDLVVPDTIFALS